MSPFLRKFSLTTHITFSVGWLGAVGGFLALAIAGIASRNIQTVQSAYSSMEVVAWFVIIPACMGSLISGITQSLGTPWGLFRHYWIVVKLMLTVAATIILLLHMQPISFMAEIASKITRTGNEFYNLRIRLIADAVVALVVLIIVTILSVYKPWGKTGYTQRDQTALLLRFTAKKSAGFYVILGLIALLLFVIILHLNGGMKGH